MMEFDLAAFLEIGATNRLTDVRGVLEAFCALYPEAAFYAGEQAHPSLRKAPLSQAQTARRIVGPQMTALR